MIDNYMWASDYPHGGSTWPRSKDAIARQFKDVPEAIEQKLTWDNAAKFYGVQ